MLKHKVVIAAVPYVNTPRPLAAPGVLKASLIYHGIDCIAIDLNLDAEQKITNHPFKEKFVDFFKHQIAHPEVIDDINLMIEHCADKILKHKPTIVALSLFCFYCQNFTLWLCAAIRQRNPGVKIVIGGPGLQQRSAGTVFFDFPGKMKQKKLIDDYITGDGEISFVEYVKGNTTYPGINSATWQRVPNLNDLPLPDYSDYEWFRYGEQSVPIIDSRGCVQDCDFCDVIVLWNKFQYLTAENIFSQMLEFMKQYKFTKFDFRSSISNGNLKEFKKLLKLISEHNLSKDIMPTERIIWDGSFIIRSSKSHDDEFFQLLKDSNPDRLFVGVESVVERVRVNLGKKFTNDDLDYFLDMTQKYNIPINLLCISGYPTETDEEFELSKQWFRERKKYINNSVMGVQIAGIDILPGTTLEKNTNIDEFVKLKQKRINKFKELRDVVYNECGFYCLDYTLMDRPN